MNRRRRLVILRRLFSLGDLRTLLLFGTTRITWTECSRMLNKTLQHDLAGARLTTSILSWHPGAYALGMVVFGRLIDKLGTRWVTRWR